MPVQGRLVGVSLPSLQIMAAAAEQAVIAGTVRGISYQIAGRSNTFPSLESASQILSEANYAIGLLNGTRATSTQANFNTAIERGSGNVASP